MPVRRALPPGLFIAGHMRDVGGVDYPQNVHREYKKYLKSMGLVNLPCRATMSHYFWLANKQGLIVFDHAETPAYWDGVMNAPRATTRTARQSRPMAPSPRYYYRIIDPDDPRWLRLEASHRQAIGIEVPPAFPRVPAEAVPVEEVEVPKPPRVKKVRVKKVKKPKPTKVKKPTPAETAAEVVAPFEQRIAKIVTELDLLRLTPTVKLADDIENQLADLGSDVLDALEGKRGLVRERLAGITTQLRMAFEHYPLVKSSLNSMLSETLPSRRVIAATSFTNAIRILREDLTHSPEEGT